MSFFTRLVAFRYLKSSSENRYFSWITVLSLMGLAIGVAALIVVLSVINGFEFELRKRFLQANAHIMVYRFPAGMVDPDKWARVIASDKEFKDEITAFSPFIHYETMAKHDAIMQGALLRGMVPKSREEVQSIADLVAPANALDTLQAEVDAHAARKALPDIPNVIVGKGLLGILNAKVGDVIQLIAPTNDKIADLKRFKVIGTYSSGLKHYDNRLILMSLPTAQRFLNMGENVIGLEIGLRDPDRSPAIAKAMEDKFQLNFREWQSFNRNIFEAMERERFVITLIVAMVVLVAGFNIFTTVFVSVSQRQRDISVLKALGARNKQIMQLFLIQSSCIGVGGSILGVILAGGISFVLQRYPFIELPEPYPLRSLPVHYSADVYLGVSISAVLICLIAGFYPAFIASRVVPTEGIVGAGDAI